MQQVGHFFKRTNEIERPSGNSVRRLRSAVGRAFALCGALLACTLGAQTHRIVPAERNCHALSATQQAWLPAPWTPFKDYTRVCAVYDSRGRSVLLLVSVWAQLYYASQKEAVVERIEMPHPLLFLPSGQVAGSLPANFPDDPPASLQVTFANWHADFPQRVKLFLVDPRAAGSQTLPSLRWDATHQSYSLVTEGSR